jgi:hypothetical protein
MTVHLPLTDLVPLQALMALDTQAMDLCRPLYPDPRPDQRQVGRNLAAHCRDILRRLPLDTLPSDHARSPEDRMTLPLDQRQRPVWALPIDAALLSTPEMKRKWGQGWISALRDAAVKHRAASTQRYRLTFSVGRPLASYHPAIRAAFAEGQIGLFVRKVPSGRIRTRDHWEAAQEATDGPRSSPEQGARDHTTAPESNQALPTPPALARPLQ